MPPFWPPPKKRFLRANFHSAGLQLPAVGADVILPRQSRRAARQSIHLSSRYVTSAMAIAKSPLRRLNSTNPVTVSSGSSGSSAATTSSSSSSAVAITPRKKSAAAILRMPRWLRASTTPSSAAMTQHHSEAGSALATLPQKVPRVRIG